MKLIMAVTLLCFFGVNDAINRPVYKILLAQKGFAQFLQYDVEIPPLREFTFCMWLRLYDFASDQTIFTYVVKGNNRVMRIWVERGGTSVWLSVAGRATATVQVNFVADAWTHMCLSYQADYGSWAIYIDGHLVACEVTQALLGYVLPGDGSVLIGYGTGENGETNGIQGEVFGANMILVSTIEKNITSQIEAQYEMTLFPKNKLKGNKNIKYTVLGDLKADDIKPRTVERSIERQKIQNEFLKHTTAANDQDIGFEFVSKDKLRNKDKIKKSTVPSSTNKNKMMFWDIVNKTGQEGKFKIQGKTKELSGSSTQELPEISLIETPPAVSPPNTEETNLQFEKPPTEKSVYNIFSTSHENPNPVSETREPFELETPPPLQANPNVYGQWTSSKFAGAVLNYLRSINFNSKPKIKKIPPTIPLTKISDSLPYATEYKVTNAHRKISSPNKTYTPLKFQRTSFTDKTIIKRAKRDKEINVQILEDNLRDNILKQHAETKPINVEVTSRGDDVEKTTQRTYKFNAEPEIYKEVDEKNDFKVNRQPRPFTVTLNKKNHRMTPQDNSDNRVGLMTIMPFLKSIEYFTGPEESSENLSPDENQDIFTRTLWKANKWHNTKSYNNVYTPRQIDMEPEEMKHSMAENVAEANQQHQTIRVKYIAKDHKTVPILENEKYIEQGRIIAQRVSGKSDSGKGISLLQYNHGFLPGHKKLNETNRASPRTSVPKRKDLKEVQPPTNNFDKPIKIGNALNEGQVLGFDDEYTRMSFIGGDDKVPDINKYRSDFDTGSNDKVPPSLHALVCKSMESLYQLVLYVKPDGSIDNTHIASPIKAVNRAIEFILVNYQKCSIADTKFEDHPLLLIDWSNTPVRLFGGAYPQKTKDLCGFF